ncbi:MAG: cytochrome P450 [Anaerolineae bacterium]|nr:cytochrome P450 [Anaerolineae bacterium]
MVRTGGFDAQLTSDAFFAEPYTIYRDLREQAPIYWCEAWGAWVLTRYDDVMFTLRRSDLFSSAGRVKYLLRQLPSPARQQIAALERHYDIGLAHSDPPDHTRLRMILTSVFTPRMIAERRARIAEVVDELIDRALDAGHMDVIADFAYPLPATIIAEMIGAPRRDIGLFREWAVAINRLFERGGRITETSARAAQDSLYVMRDYILEMVRERQRQPQDDLLGRLVAAESEADRLSVDELVSTAVTFFVAGHETTTNLIGNGALALLQHPDQRQLLREDPALMPDAIEEMLRYDPSVPRGWRIAREDVTIDGQTIDRGALVFPILAAANRDPAHFPDPDRFDIRRVQDRHVAFGYGIHFCLGAPLARLEGAIALEALFRRLPEMQLDGSPLSWRHDVAIRSLNSLPVTV